MSGQPEGPTGALTLLVALALSTVIVGLGVVTRTAQWSYAGLAAWFVALAASALWLVWKDRG